MKTLTVLTLVTVTALTACGQSVAGERIASTPPATLATAEQLRFFSITDARTIGLFIAMANPTIAAGDSCVTRTTEGATTVLTGNGCMTGSTRYDGVLRFSGDPVTGAESRAEYQNWRQTSAVSCNGSSQTLSVGTTTRGTVRVVARGNVREFDVDIVLEQTEPNREACTFTTTTLAVQYHGTLDFTGPSGVARDSSAPMRASGSGIVADSRFGRVDTSTSALVFDSTVCAGEPASGTLTLRAGTHTGIVTYDGASHCGMGSTRTAPITVDGMTVSEVPVNACSVRGAAGSAKHGAVALVALGAAVATALARRRGAR